MDVVRWRAFRSATEWKGHAAQVTTGAARAVNMYPQPGTLALGTIANNVDRSASGTNNTAATSSRRSSLRAWAPSGSFVRLSRTVVSVCGAAWYPAFSTTPHSSSAAMPTASMVATRVAKLTDARTPGILLSFVSTRLAQAAHDIPETSSRIRRTDCRSASPTTGAATALLGSAYLHPSAYKS